MSLNKQPPPTVFEQQPDATLNQINPVSGQKYTVLDTTKNARITALSIRCTWSIQPTLLEIHLTIDGQNTRFFKSDPVSGTIYFAGLETDAGLDWQPLSTTDYAKQKSFLWEGRSVKVEAEITGGTVSNLVAKARYTKL